MPRQRQPVVNDGSDGVLGRWRLLSLGIALIAACLSCTPGPGTNDPPQVSVEVSDPELAAFLAAVLEAARTDPEDAEARGRLGMAYEMNDLEDAALLAYAQAEGLDPTDFRWPYFQALVVSRQGNPEAALVHLERALSVDAEYAPAWLWQGSFLLDLGRDAEAAIAFQRARDLDAEVHAATGLAQLALRQDRPADALTLLHPLQRDNPHPQVFRLLGRAYQALGRVDDARIAMARGKDATPLRWDDPREADKAGQIMSLGGLLALAEDVIRAHRYDAAVQILVPLRVRYPNDKALLGNLALAYGRSGQTAQALDVLRHAFSLHPDHAPFHNVMSSVLEEKGDRDGTRHHLEESIRLNPAQAWVHERLGRIRMGMGDYDAALASFDAAVRYGIDQPASVLHLAGSIEGARERWPDAIAYFKRAVALDESHTDAYIYLAICQAEVGNLDEADAALSWAEKLGNRRREIAAARQRLARAGVASTVAPDPVEQ